MFNLVGRTAVVTGATGGLGGAIAQALYGAGAAVLLTGRRQAALDELAASLGDRARTVVADVASTQGVETIVDAAGDADILVNNAGITRDNLALRLKDADWQDVLETNLLAAFRLSRAVLRGMMKRRFGRIVNISSIVGVTGNAGQANYAAAKAGLIAMSKSLAQEVGSRGITVNCVAPGFIETAMTATLDAERRRQMLAAIPAGRLGLPADVAAGVLYLASDEAAYVTGETLHINGGMAMS